MWLLLVTGLGVGGALGYVVALVRAGTRKQNLEIEVTRLSTAIAAERAAFAERLQAAQATQTQLSQEFKALAAEALQMNNQQFLSLADQHLRTTQVAGQADMAKRAVAIEAMVEPLNTSLTQLRTQLGLAEESRVHSAATLTEQMRVLATESQSLRSQTSQLVTALRTSDVRGAWGEAQLRRLVESAGMLNRVDFSTQVTVQTDDGQLRPDMVVHLAGNKNIVVDSKVALVGYLDSMSAQDDAVRLDRMGAHVRHVKKHVDDLAAKAYWDQFTNSPEFVVMFLPAESFLSAALDHDPSILDYAFARNIVIATPTTLLALLKTVSFTWRQEAITENAQQVLKVGKELHDRLAVLSGHLSKVGRAIQTSAETYNRAISSYESRVLVSARRLEDLDLVSQELDTPALVNAYARQPAVSDAAPDFPAVAPAQTPEQSPTTLEP